MLSPRLTNCPECANIPSLLKKIDCKLAELGNSLYNNVSYMLNQPIPAGDILQLIGYRRILTYKYCNPNYVHEYSVAMIASRVIRITVGCVSRCNEPERCLEDPCEIDVVANPTTTSTTTLTSCKSYILYNTATSAESFLIGNCDTGQPETITLQGLSSVCISTIVALNVSPNIVVMNTNECTTTTTSTSSTSSTTTSTTTIPPSTTTTTSSSSTSTTTSSSSTSTTTSTSSSSTTTTTTTLAPINPDDIAGLWAWYKGDAGVIGGAQVTTWTDQSISGNDLLTELSAYPEAVTDTVGTLSTTVVRKVNFATLASMATAANFPNTNSTGSSMFVVCKVITSPGILQYVVKAPNMELYTNTTPAMNSVIGGGATLTQTVAYNQYYTFRNGTDLINEYFSVNNATTLTSPDAAGFYLPRKFRIFAQNGPILSEQGDVAFAEIIVYNTSLTPTEILGVETYLRNKYNHY
jgi:hypothetical protein